MISLRNDIYAHLALSAQKFKTPRQPITSPSHPVSLAEKNLLDHKSSTKNGSIRTRVEKIDEKVNRLLKNPQVQSLQRQLEQLTMHFTQLRASANRDDVLRIENKILLLETLLKEKSYV